MPIITALFFSFLSSFACILSDIFSKLFQGSIQDLLCLRFFFATLISFACYRSFGFFSIKNIIRGSLFWLSMLCFTKGLRDLPLTLVIFINFATPIWNIILSKLLLKEKIRHRLYSCIVNTIGIIVALYPMLNGHSIKPILYILAASFLFSLIDVLNKYSMNQQEKIGNILIGSSFFSFLFCLPSYSFKAPCYNDSLILIGISLSALAIPYFMLLASKKVNLSTLQPIKYLEFPMTILANNILFQDIIHKETYYGFAIIFVGTFLNYLYEIKTSNKRI